MSKEDLSVSLSEFRVPTREEMIAADPLGEFHVWWDDITIQDVAEFEAVLDAATSERPLQHFLAEHPIILAQRVVGGGHGRWVIPEKRLGSEHAVDFVVGEKSSIGFEWAAVELESPTHKLFTKKGDPTKELTHAIRQITDWRAWLAQNQNYASRPRTDQGLGLTDIRADVPGFIVIGRRAAVSDETKARRRQLGTQSNIRIHTYDWLLDVARRRVGEQRKATPGAERAPKKKA